MATTANRPDGEEAQMTAQEILAEQAELALQDFVENYKCMENLNEKTINFMKLAAEHYCSLSESEQRKVFAAFRHSRLLNVLDCSLRAIEKRKVRVATDQSQRRAQNFAMFLNMVCDVSNKKLCEEIGSNEQILRLIVEQLASSRMQRAERDSALAEQVHAYARLLNYCAVYAPGKMSAAFSRAGGLETLRFYYEERRDSLAFRAVVIISHLVVSVEQSATILADSVLRMLVKDVRVASESPSTSDSFRFGNHLDLVSLLETLNRLIKLGQDTAERLVHHGLVADLECLLLERPVLVKESELGRFTPESTEVQFAQLREQLAALHCLLLVSFCSLSSQLIVKRRELLCKLDDLFRSHAVPHIQKAAYAVLQNLEQTDTSVSQQVDDTQSRVIFISFCKSDEKMAYLLRDELTDAGFLVRCATECEQLGEAIGQAAFVLVCFSKHYYQDVFCQLQFRMALRWRKMLLPLKISTYSPTGWLESLLEDESCYDISNKEAKRQNWRQVVRMMSANRTHSEAAARSDSRKSVAEMGDRVSSARSNSTRESSDGAS